MKLLDLFEAGPPIDNINGLGAVGASGNIDYLGLRVWVKPSVFLKLAAPHPDPRSDYIEQHIAAGEPIGAPFLSVHIPQEWFSEESRYDQVIEGDLSKPAMVAGHEGRHRMTAILKIYGDEPVETHILLNGLRRRHMTDRMIERLNESIVSQTRKLVRGPWFVPAKINEQSALSEIFNNPYELPHRWVHDHDGGYYKEITLPSSKMLTIKIDWEPYDKIAIWNFWVDDDQGITGSGDAVRIFSTALAAFQQFVKSKKPMIIAFMGNDLDKSRIKLYDRLVYWLTRQGQLTDYVDVTSFSSMWPDELIWYFDERYEMDGKIYVLIHKRYKKIESVDENFADGKGPGRPGDSRRHGIPKNATLAQLDKIGKGKGRKAQLARWQANMRRGRAKTRESLYENITKTELIKFNDGETYISDHFFDRANEREVSLRTLAYMFKHMQDYLLGDIAKLGATEFILRNKNGVGVGIAKQLMPDDTFRYVIKTVHPQLRRKLNEPEFLLSKNSNNRNEI